MVRPDGPAETFLNRYAEFAADPAPSGLRHHYVAYRAVVRAKVALLRHDQGEPHAAADATAHLELALRHLRDGAVRLALVGGLPATGKTTLGGAIADRFGAVLLSSDRLRKELAGIDPETPVPADFGQGLYDGPHQAPCGATPPAPGREDDHRLSPGRSTDRCRRRGMPAIVPCGGCAVDVERARVAARPNARTTITPSWRA